MIQKLRTINFQELTVFVAIVREKGITSASKKLGIAKSAVSTQLSRLETKLNVKLLERSSRRISLTPAGEHLLPRIESLIAEGARLLEQAEVEVTEPAGIVRVALTPDFGALVVSQMFPLITQQYPKITLASTFSYGFEDMQETRFDFAIRIGNIDDDNLVAHQLGQFKRILVASPEYLNSHSIQVPADLNNANCLLFSGRDSHRIWQLKASDKQRDTQLIDVSGDISVFSFTTLIKLATSGHGIIQVADVLVRSELASGQLVRVLPMWECGAADVYLVYRFGTDKINRVKAVIDLIRHNLPEIILTPR